MSNGGHLNFGVYVHIPFCSHRCDYCDFATWTDRDHLVHEYVEACAVDITRRYERSEHPAATSVFFGGGTPSLLEAGLLMRILDAIPRADDAEVTVECNPDSIDRGKLERYRHHGVNRISLGVQSMAPHVLRALGRTHNPDNVERAVAAIRAVGFPTFNLDLIHGAAGESSDDWRRTVDATLGLAPPHVAAYMLTVERGTPLDRRVRDGELDPPADDDQADKYVAVDEALTSAGLHWYEVSNWARPGHECRHNRLYWRGEEYLGIGCAAHGLTGGERWWNVRTPERYIAAIRADEPPAAGSEILGGDGAVDEALMLALRTSSGAVAPPNAPVDLLVGQGLINQVDDRVVLTRRGRLLASEVTVRLLAR